MKLSFSTLACPGYSWAELYSVAKDFGFHGIEMRGLGGDIFDVHASPFLPENLPETKATLKRLKLEICCLSSGCALKFADRHAETIEELKEYIALAKELETPYIRVLGDLKAEPEDDFPDENVIEPMKILAPIAEEAGVMLLIETNGVYSDTARLADVLARIGSDSVAALWDWNHPYRFNGESPETTIKNLGAFIKHCHIKDSVMEDGKVKYRLVGEGDLPKMEEYMKALRSLNYEGYISLEWLRQYAPELSEAGIVLPHYVHFMSQYLDGGSDNIRLQKSIRGDGYYVWEKNQLIDLTFPQVLDRMCEEFPDQWAFRYTEMDYSRTYSEFRDD
ncbi:MAG: TIM barrel protein, partial [Clostridia bacterium]|nr:TIM barrel protein [Clostridia bacterium]